ncbi:MAG TPA: DUF2213 domain-containing protein [Polyangiaceae bacterium]|jgi:hypothetical protein|nr:DUF2213 domain-containing protein [Polyangiaceae bacterium]
MERIQRYDLRSGEVTRTSSGGRVASARVTRTGVLTYRLPDGSTRREYRPPEEVFSPDSLASLAHATLTDDHPGKVTPDNWRRMTIGHVAGSPQRDGKFVAADLHIQHGDAIEKAEGGELADCSCGYDCMFDPTPGVTPEGEKYDGIQRGIRYNHVALGPPGWGRAGREVSMRLDSATAISGYDEGGNGDMDIIEDGADQRRDAGDERDASGDYAAFVARKKGAVQARRDREAGNGRGTVTGARSAEIVTAARSAAATLANQSRTVAGPFRESNLPTREPNLANYPDADPFSDADAITEQQKMNDRKKNGVQARRDREARERDARGGR